MHREKNSRWAQQLRARLFDSFTSISFNGHFPSDTTSMAVWAVPRPVRPSERRNLPFPPSETSSSSHILRVRRKAGQGCRLGTELPPGHQTIAGCEFPRSRLSGVRDRLEAPDPLEDLPEEILRQRDLRQLEGDVAVDVAEHHRLRLV